MFIERRELLHVYEDLCDLKLYNGYSLPLFESIRKILHRLVLKMYFEGYAKSVAIDRT